MDLRIGTSLIVGVAFAHWLPVLLFGLQSDAGRAMWGWTNRLYCNFGATNGVCVESGAAEVAPGMTCTPHGGCSSTSQLECPAVANTPPNPWFGPCGWGSTCNSNVMTIGSGITCGPQPTPVPPTPQPTPVPPTPAPTMQPTQAPTQQVTSAPTAGPIEMPTTTTQQPLSEATTGPSPEVGQIPLPTQEDTQQCSGQADLDPRAMAHLESLGMKPASSGARSCAENRNGEATR